MQLLITNPVRIYRLQLIGENVPLPAQTGDEIALVRYQKKAVVLERKDINHQTVIDNIPRTKLKQVDIDLTLKKKICMEKHIRHGGECIVQKALTEKLKIIQQELAGPNLH